MSRNLPKLTKEKLIEKMVKHLENLDTKNQSIGQDIKLSKVISNKDGQGSFHSATLFKLAVIFTIKNSASKGIEKRWPKKSDDWLKLTPVTLADRLFDES